MEKMYEILRFIEHGGRCRQSMDCLEGTILIYYLKEHPQVDKSVLFDWFRQIGKNLDQYHRSRNGQNYRYLNPYSVVVTEEGSLFLLNLEAPENEFALKKMQQRAVRNHFVKPVFTRGAGELRSADLFAFGRMIQFMLACMEVFPALNRREEMRLSRIAERCVGEGRKKYGEMEQILRDLPQCSSVRTGVGERRRQVKYLAGATAAVCVLFFAVLVPGAEKEGTENGLTSVRAGENTESMQEADMADRNISQKDEDMTSAPDWSEEQTDEAISAEECTALVSAFLKGQLLENTAAGNRETVRLGLELEREVLKNLAAACEREEMQEEAVQAYERLLEIEESKEILESVGIKKMELEAGMEQYAKAVLTGESLLEKLPDSEKIKDLTEEYRRESEGSEEKKEESGAEKEQKEEEAASDEKK